MAPFAVLRGREEVRFRGLSAGGRYGIYSLSGTRLASSGSVRGGEWTWRPGARTGVVYLVGEGGSGFHRAFLLE